MKNMTLFAGTLLLSLSAFASGTTSQATAKQMIAILKSKPVATLLAQEDGLGNVQGIRYLYSGRAIFGPAVYELTFNSYSAATPQTCTVAASINTQTNRIFSVSPASCQEIK
jgi:hypothetical protein